MKKLEKLKLDNQFMNNVFGGSGWSAISNFLSSLETTGGGERCEVGAAGENLCISYTSDYIIPGSGGVRGYNGDKILDLKPGC